MMWFTLFMWHWDSLLSIPNRIKIFIIKIFMILLNIYWMFLWHFCINSLTWFGFVHYFIEMVYRLPLSAFWWFLINFLYFLWWFLQLMLVFIFIFHFINIGNFLHRLSRIQPLIICWKRWLRSWFCLMKILWLFLLEWFLSWPWSGFWYRLWVKILIEKLYTWRCT